MYTRNIVCSCYALSFKSVTKDDIIYCPPFDLELDPCDLRLPWKGNGVSQNIMFCCYLDVFYQLIIMSRVFKLNTWNFICKASPKQKRKLFLLCIYFSQRFSNSSLFLLQFKTDISKRILIRWFT